VKINVLQILRVQISFDTLYFKTVTISNIISQIFLFSVDIRLIVQL